MTKAVSCPECGADLKSDKDGNARVVCHECGERVLLVPKKASTVMEIICPSCGLKIHANKLEGEGTAEVPCRHHDEKVIVCVSTDKRGRVSAVKIKQKEVKKYRWDSAQILALTIIGLFLLLFLGFLLRR